MIARSLAALILGTVVLALGACQAPQKGPATPAVDKPNSDRSSLGYLEHRGRRHALLDLLDPAYREASDDPAARDFNVADHWARESSLSADVRRTKEPRRACLPKAVDRARGIDY
jgi:hypothetical protein